MILAGGVGQLAVGDLRADEVAGAGLVGQPGAPAQHRRRLERAAQGPEDYLVVRAPASRPPR
jgi:hypothetical protein